MKYKFNTNKLNKHNLNTNTKKKGQLFSDNNPETTVHGYGFSNPKVAEYTLQDLKYRDIDYQFQVVNTMYNRCKQVIKKTKDTSRIKILKQSLAIYNKWIKNYKSKQRNTKESYPYLSPQNIRKLEFLAEYYNISRKARGLEKPTKSDKGFLPIWESVKGDKKQLRNLPIKKTVPNGQTWDKHRNFFIVRRLSMINNARDKLYYTSGPNKGLPTPLHVNMMMWGYSSDSKNVMKNINTYKNIINNK